VGIIELDLVKFGEIVPVGIIEFEALDDILNSSAAEEVLLFKP
jgi:hypothetical protein